MNAQFEGQYSFGLDNAVRRVGSASCRTGVQQFVSVIVGRGVRSIGEDDCLGDSDSPGLKF